MSSLPIRMKNPMWNPIHEYYTEDLCPCMEYYGMRHPAIFQHYPSYHHTYPKEHYPSYHHTYPKEKLQDTMQHNIVHSTSHPIMKQSQSYSKLQPIEKPMVHHNEKFMEYPIQHSMEYHDRQPMEYTNRQPIEHPIQQHHIQHPMVTPTSYPKVHHMVHHTLPDMYRSITM